MRKHDKTIAFIGAGNMAEALVCGILRARLFAPRNIRAADVDAFRRKMFKTKFKVACYRDNRQAAAGADLLVLAVKPNVVPAALDELKGRLARDVLVVSIAAGVGTAFLESRLGKGVRVIRVMPNTAALVGKGAAAFCLGRRATAADALQVEAIFRAVGVVVRVREPDIDAVTALSGSGPAYVYFLVESMEQAAKKMKLPPGAARALAVATVEGAAHMLAETGLDPEELRRRVTSRGGTTERAIDVLRARRVQEAFVEAMCAAQRHSLRLQRGFGAQNKTGDRA